MSKNYDLVREISSRNGMASAVREDELNKLSLLYSIIDVTRKIDDRIQLINRWGNYYEVGKYYIPFQEAFFNYRVGDYLNGHMLVSTKRRDEGRHRPYLYYVKLK